jgi:hypothetical protein
MKGNLKGPASTLDIKYEAVKVFLKDIEIDQTLSFFFVENLGTKG